MGAYSKRIIRIIRIGLLALNTVSQLRVHACRNLFLNRGCNLVLE